MQLEVAVKTERNYGIDLLRLVSMLYVLILHTLGRGGVLDFSIVSSIQYRFSWFLEMWAYCAVNIFALISGYVGYSDKIKKYRYSSYLVMWFQVVAYGVALTLLFYLIDPELVTRRQLLQMFFPLTSQLYWYFTAYTGLFFVIPLINGAVRQSSNEYLRRAVLGFILLFSVFDIVTCGFEFSQGHSFAWLVFMYFLGATLKKCEIGKQMTIPSALLGILICCILSWCWRMYVEPIKLFDKVSIDPRQVCSYVTPMHLIAAIFHVILFSKLKIGKILKKMIAFAAPGAFAVYIVNNQMHVWDYVMRERFVYLVHRSVLTIFMHVMAFSLLFLVVVVLVDHIRQKLFIWLRIRQIAEHITDRLGRLLGWCADRFLG